MGLGIREARDGLPELVKRAVYQLEEFRIGARGSDEATLIATSELNRLRLRLAQLEGEMHRASGAEAPFAGLMRNLEAGMPLPDEPRVRRRIMGIRQESGISRAEMAALGARHQAEPRRRRSVPRA